MAAKKKKFDCVEMKNRIQAECMAEYLAQKDKYVSFLDFINARTAKSEWVRRVREKLGMESPLQ
ncbi:MAG: hypothetical protein HY706_02640 [Candidatus Hydrogenedentes bacterium]|nr:hypothetical protein [Candidatus Hydrogenedentota bacterium]